MEVFKLDIEKDLSKEGKEIMRAVRKAADGKKGMLGYIFKAINKREYHIAELELLLLAKSYQDQKLYSMITFLGESDIPITVKTLEILIEKSKCL